MTEENGKIKPMRLGTTRKRLNVDAVRSGVRLECPFRPGLFVTILPGANYNPHYRDAVQARAGEESWQVDDPDFIADALIATMDGIADAESGDAVPYTKEIGLAILKDEENVDVKEWVITQAHRYGRFYSEDVGADAKN